MERVTWVVLSLVIVAPVSVRTATTGWMDHAVPATPVGTDPVYAPSGCVMKPSWEDAAPASVNAALSTMVFVGIVVVKTAVARSW